MNGPLLQFEKYNFVFL